MNENISKQVKTAFVEKFFEIAKWVKSVATEQFQKDEKLTLITKDADKPISYGIGNKRSENEYCIFFKVNDKLKIFWSNRYTSFYSNKKTAEEFINEMDTDTYNIGREFLAHWDEVKKEILNVVTSKRNTEEINFINSINVYGNGTTERSRRPIRRIELD